MRILLLAGLLFLPSSGFAADTEAAALARGTSLKTKVSVDAQNASLIDFLKELSAQAEMQLAKPPKWTYAPDVSKSEKVTYRCRDKPIEEILADVLKGPGYGYVVISGENERLDGFVRITKGDDRGFATDTASLANRQAQARLDTAKELIKAGKKVPAKAVLSLLIKENPNTPIAAEAAKLLEGLDK